MPRLHMIRIAFPSAEGGAQFMFTTHIRIPASIKREFTRARNSDLGHLEESGGVHVRVDEGPQRLAEGARVGLLSMGRGCLLYTSDAADD